MPLSIVILLFSSCSHNAFGAGVRACVRCWRSCVRAFGAGVRSCVRCWRSCVRAFGAGVRAFVRSVLAVRCWLFVRSCVRCWLFGAGCSVLAVRAFVRSCVRAFVRSCVRVWVGGWVLAPAPAPAPARAGRFYTERGTRSPPLASARLRSGLDRGGLFGAQKCPPLLAGGGGAVFFILGIRFPSGLAQSFSARLRLRLRGRACCSLCFPKVGGLSLVPVLR